MSIQTREHIVLDGAIRPSDVVFPSDVFLLRIGTTTERNSNFIDLSSGLGYFLAVTSGSNPKRFSSNSMVLRAGAK
jgi:hypothetical protein